MRPPTMLRVVVLFALCGAAPSPGQEQPVGVEESMYSRSLHFTNRGLEFIYSKEHGGLERLTGMSATELNCLQAKCHVRSCDTCHAAEVDGRRVYSVAQARKYEVCERCHPVAKDDPDVHYSRGMRCVDCHGAADVHGDGVAYDTYMQPGVIKARCESCHTDIPKSASHTVHQGKLACPTCHALDVVTCLNCHIDSRLAKKKESAIERHGMFFLVNHGGKVKLANFLTYVYGNKTMITLAPVSPHSITKKARACGACHATPIVDAVKAGTLAPVAWRDGALTNVEGVIPVVEGMTWNLVFLGRDGETWVPLDKPEPPLVNFSGFCAPLSAEQLARLEKPRGRS